MRLAIMFHGHLRTYKQTYESFLKCIVEPQIRNGWEVDIFIHTWDQLNQPGYAPWHNYGAWHNSLTALEGVKLTEADIKSINIIYKPKKIIIGTLDDLKQDAGFKISYPEVQNLALDYEKQMGFKYDWYMVLRPDLYFRTPLDMRSILDYYNSGRFNEIVNDDKSTFLGIPQKCIFVSHNTIFVMPTSDPRGFANVLLWFGNFAPMPMPNKPIELYKDNIYCITIKYASQIDYFLQRIKYRHGWDLGWVWNGSEEQINIYEKLKKFEKLEKLGFVKFYFYIRKRLVKLNHFFAELRHKTRTLRYSVKAIFGFNKDKSISSKE